MNAFFPSSEEVSAGFVTHASFLVPPVDIFRLQAEDPAYSGRFDRALCHSVLCFRKEFSVSLSGSYTAFITADDSYKLYLNGTLVCSGPAPAHLHVYNVEKTDVTSFLKEGTNAAALEIYYQGTINRERVSGDNRCGFFLSIRDENGTEVLSSRDGFRCIRNRGYLPGDPFGYVTQFPQHYDFRLAPKGWTERGFDDSLWEPAVRADGSSYHFVPSRLPPMPLYPVRTEAKQQAGGLFYDFGTEEVGYLFFRVRGKAGDSFRLQCGEELNEDGTVRCRMRCNCVYDDLITLDDGENALIQIDYKGFRYAFLAFDAPIEVLDFGVLVRHHPFDPEAFSFESDNPLFNDIIRICREAVRVNAQYNYLDCVTREKGAYNGDMTVIGAAHLYLTGNPDLYAKCIEDFQNTADIVPAFNDYANCGLVDGALAEYTLGFPAQALLCYRYTGNRDELLRAERSCQALLDYYAPYVRSDGLLVAPFGEGLFRKEILVDWPVTLRDDYDFPASPQKSVGCMSLINAYYIGALEAISDIRQRLGMPGIDTAAIRSNYLAAFFDRDAGLFRDGEGSDHHSLHANALSAYFGLFPEDDAHAKEAFLSMVREKGLACGTYMSYFLLSGLCRMGERELAFALITNTGRNSWYTMLKGGAVTCWESWDAGYKPNNSLCHAWSSAPLLILVEEFLGLHVDVTKGCGYTLNPNLPAGLGHVKAKLPTPIGTVSVE